MAPLYIGETGRCFETPRKEHMMNVKSCAKGSNTAKHNWLFTIYKKKSGNFSWNVNRKTNLVFPNGKFPGKTGFLERWTIRSFWPVPGPSDWIAWNCKWNSKSHMEIPIRVLTLAFHIPHLSPNRVFWSNGKQPESLYLLFKNQVIDKGSFCNRITRIMVHCIMQITIEGRFTIINPLFKKKNRKFIDTKFFPFLCILL